MYVNINMNKFASSYILMYAVVSSAPKHNPDIKQVNNAFFSSLNTLFDIRYIKILENTYIIMFKIIPVHFVNPSIVNDATILSSK